MKVFWLINGSSRETNKSPLNTMLKQRWGLDRNVLRPIPGDPWGVEQHLWSNAELQLDPKVRDYNFKYIFSGISNLTVCFNTSTYVTIILLPFDENLTVLLKSKTELRSVKYGNPAKWNVQKYGRWPPLKFRQFLSMAVIFNGYILAKMLYWSIIMTTAGIKWCNDGIPDIFENFA